MNRSPVLAAMVAVVFLTIISSNHPAQAQVPPTVTNTYAAKFICGVQKDGGLNTMPDAQPGRYSSKINVHNNTGVLIKFRKKIIRLRGGQSPIDPQAKIPQEGLKPDQAMEVVCTNIYKHLGIALNLQSPPPYIEGFVILEVLQSSPTEPAPPPDPLDVEGIYTYKGDVPGVAGSPSGSGVSIAVVVFPAKSNKHPLP